MSHTLLNLVLVIFLATVALLSAARQPVVGAESAAMSRCSPSDQAGGRCTAIDLQRPLDQHIMTVPGCDYSCFTVQWDVVPGCDTCVREAELAMPDMPSFAGDRLEAGIGGQSRTRLRPRVALLFDQEGDRLSGPIDDSFRLTDVMGDWLGEGFWREFGGWGSSRSSSRNRPRVAVLFDP